MPHCDATRRDFIIAMAAGTLAGCDRKVSNVNDSPTLAKTLEYIRQHPELNQRQRDLLIKIAPEVERDYTTAIVRIHYRGRIYDIPANYMHLSGRTRFKEYLQAGVERYELHATSEFLGDWHFFWPSLEGYTLDNWFNEFDRRLIQYKWFQINPPNYQRSTEEVFELIRATNQIELTPSAELYGLKGYRRINQNEYVWIGERKSGAMFMMSSFHPEDTTDRRGQTNPQCDVRLCESVPDGQDDVMYLYSLDLFQHWREIDQQTQAKIQSWRVA